MIIAYMYYGMRKDDIGEASNDWCLTRKCESLLHSILYLTLANTTRHI